jgi:hypothetical protein
MSGFKTGRNHTEKAHKRAFPSAANPSHFTHPVQTPNPHLRNHPRQPRRGAGEYNPLAPWNKIRITKTAHCAPKREKAAGGRREKWGGRPVLREGPHFSLRTGPASSADKARDALIKNIELCSFLT